MNESNDKERAARGAWRSQALDAPPIDPRLIAQRAERLDKDRRREMRVVWATLATCLVLMAALILNLHGKDLEPMKQTLQLAGVLLLASCAYLLYQLERRTRALNSEEDGHVASLSAYRSELRRRRDLYHRNWQWSLWPALPALITVIVGGVLYDQRPGTLWRYAASTVVAVVGLTIAVIHYRRKGDQFQRELDALTDLDAK